MRIVPIALVLAVLIGACGGAPAKPADLPAETGTPQGQSGPLPAPTAHTPVAKADLVRGVAIEAMRLGVAERLPEGVLFYYTPRCVNCDGGPSPLYRLYRLGGTVNVEPVFNFPGASDRFVFSYATDIGRGLIYAALCTVGFCGDGIVGPNDGAENVVFRSLDAGVTWEQMAPLSPFTTFVAIVDGRPLTATARTEPGSVPRYRFYPAGPDVPLPPNARGLYVQEGAIFYTDYAGSRFDAAGNVLALQPELMIDGNPAQVTLRFHDGSDLISFVWAPAMPGDNPPFRTLIAMRDPAGRITRVFADASRTSFRADLLLGEHGIFGLFQPQPTGNDDRPVLARFDVATGTIHPVPEASMLPPRLFPSIVYAVQGKVLVRVNIPGDCLNVREGPSLTSPLVGCAAHGSVLASSGETVTEDGVEWLAIAMADGRSGHVNARFLER